MSEVVDKDVAGIYGILKDKAAPAQVGKPVYGKDIEIVKSLGARNMGDLFGHKEDGSDMSKGKSINFGSKADTQFLPEETRLRLFALKQMIANAEAQAQVINRTATVSAAQIMETPIYKQSLAGILKAFNVTDFSSWIPLINARFYFEEYEIPYLLANEFDTQPMDSATVKVEGALGLLEGKEEGDSNTFDNQSNTQSDFTVFSRNNVVSTLITEDLLSDSAPAIINKLRKEVMMALVRSYERAIINGDTAQVSVRGDNHQDSDTRAISKHYSKAFDGLRKRALSNSGNGVITDNAGDTLSKATFTKVIKSLGIFAAEKDDLCWVISTKNALDLVSGIIPELSTNFAFGGLASTRTGLMPPVFGVKVVESRYVREDLNASGVYDGVTTDRTSLILVKRSRFQNFLRAASRTWAQPAINSDQMYMMSKCRQAFAGNPQTAVEKSVAMAINIALS